MTGGGKLGVQLVRRAEESVSETSRQRRWEELLARFPRLEDMRVLDLGGATWIWTSAPVRPKSVVVLNLDKNSLQVTPSWLTTVCADACDPPVWLLAEEFDLVYSNSVIEHLGGYWRRRRFAETVQRTGHHHWIQTPARYFPVEPHWMFPCFQFLPPRARAFVSRNWRLKSPVFEGTSREQSLDDALSIELVSTAEMRMLFPGSTIYRERVAGLTKSIVAVR